MSGQLDAAAGDAAPPVVAGPDGTGEAERAAQAEVDWQKRYSDLQPEYTRTTQENAELKRANEILKAASAFFAAELCATRRRVDRGRVRDRPRRVVAAAW